MEKNEINWEQRRYEIAKKMLAAIHINDGADLRCDEYKDCGFDGLGYEGSAREAVRFADALIGELRKSE